MSFTPLRLLPLALLLLAGAAAAQEPTPPASPKGPRARIEFGVAPQGWERVPQEQGKRRFILEFRLPPGVDEAEGPQVTVLRVDRQRTFPDYQERLRAGWTKADGAALAAEDQQVSARKEEPACEIRVVEQSGTQTPKGGAAQPGRRLVAVFVKLGEDSWSVWLLGSEAGVARNRDAFLAWIDGAHKTTPPAAPEGAGDDEGRE